MTNSNTIGPDANIYVINVSISGVHVRLTNNGASRQTWICWSDLEAATSPANAPDLRALYFRALEAARVMRVVACPKHVADSTRTEGFSHAVAEVAGADGGFASSNNPSAHGGICLVDTCSCGATRRSNVNGKHAEIGVWVYETKKMLDEQGYPMALSA